MKNKIYLIYNEIYKEIPNNIGYVLTEEKAIKYVEEWNKDLESHAVNERSYYEEVELIEEGSEM